MQKRRLPKKTMAMRNNILSAIKDLVKPRDPEYSAKAWGKKIGVSGEAISGGWFKKRSAPESDKVAVICELANLSANWLFFRKGPKKLSDAVASHFEELQRARKTIDDLTNIIIRKEIEIERLIRNR